MKHVIVFICCMFFVFIACSSSKKVTKSDDTEVLKKYTPTEYTGPKKKLAIARFENNTRFGKRRLGDNITDVLSTELSQTNRFILLERAEVDKILDQVALSQAGITEGSLEQIQLLDADYIATGAVTHYAVNTTGSSNLFTQSKTQKAEVAADVRIIDIRTGEILLSASGRGTAEKDFDKVLGMGESGGYDESLEMDAFRAAVIDMVENIIPVLDNLPWTCDVVKVSGTKLYIDAGKKSNLPLGTVLDIYQKGEEIKNLSGKSIGYEEKLLSKGTITEFFGNDGAIVSADSLQIYALPLFCRLHNNQK